MEILKNVLEENISYYKKLEKEISARLISLSKGSIKKRKVSEEDYYYLQQRKGNKVIQKYLGKSVPEDLLKELEERRIQEIELKKVKASLKILREKSSSSDILLSPLKELFYLLTKYGLWDEGLEIIGSWCFKIYQDYFGVEKFPLRTEDIDILIPLPYKGKVVRVPELLKEIGFKEGFNPDGSMYFYQIGLRVDFVVPERGRGFEKGVKINKLSLSAQSLRFLDILFEYPREISVARGIKIKVPSPSSFLVHKLIVLQRRKNKADMLKDMKQSICVAKSIIQDKEERKVIKKLYLSLSESWKKRVIKGINLVQKELPLEIPVLKETEKILI